MFITDWITPAAGVRIEAFAWRTENVEQQPVEQHVDGTLVVEYADGDRAQFAPIRRAAYDALVQVENDPAFRNVFESITEEATKQGDEEDENEDIQQTIDSLEDLLGELDSNDVNDIIDIDDNTGPYPRPWEDEEDDDDLYQPYWGVDRGQDVVFTNATTTTRSSTSDVEQLQTQQRF